jgi:hypothetical protein
MTGANLTNATLRGARTSRPDLVPQQWGGVVWSNTTCPDGTNSNANGGTCLGHFGPA